MYMLKYNFINLKKLKTIKFISISGMSVYVKITKHPK